MQYVVRPYTPKMQTMMLAHVDAQMAAQMAEVRRLNAALVLLGAGTSTSTCPPLPPRPSLDDGRLDDDRLDGLPVLPESLY